MSTVQKWIMGMVGLGAGYLVLVHPKAFYTAATGAKQLIGGTETQIITGGRRG